MTKINIRPIGLSISPQCDHGDAIRLAGGMTYAHRFALIRREGAQVVERELASAKAMPAAIEALPTELQDDANTQWQSLQSERVPLQLGERTIRLDQPQVMGILNVTPDSFSDGGEFMDDVEAQRTQAAKMHEAGASIIDIGGESTRPGAKAVWEGDEVERVKPAIEHCLSMGAAVSVDTRKGAVIEAALEAGVHIINDVSALRYDPRAAGLVAKSGVPVILMHAPGEKDDLHAKNSLEGGEYANVVFDVFDFLREARERAIVAGIAREKIILDPGIGFGKSLADNLALLNALPMFHALGQPLLLGVSRKRMIGALSNEADEQNRLGGSIALATQGMNAGVQLLRVHDVAETVQARNVWRGLRDAALTDFAQLPA